MGCISQFSKYIIFLFNFIIAVCAIILIVFGVIFTVAEKDSGVNVFDNNFSLGALAIAIGAIIFVIAFLGCCGAIKENSCLLTTYAIILIGLFVIQIVLGVLAVLKIKDSDELKDRISKIVEKMFNPTESKDVKKFDNIQKIFKCCGFNGFKDYDDLGIMAYPPTCCEDKTDPCLHPFEIGCSEAISDIIKKNIVIIGYVAIAFAVVELVGAMFAFMISKSKKRKQYA